MSPPVLHTTSRAPLLAMLAALLLAMVPGSAIGRPRLGDVPADDPVTRDAPGPDGILSVPMTIAFQGFLTDAGGVPLDAVTVDLLVQIYDIPGGSESLWAETHAAVPVDKGVFQIALGSIQPLSKWTFANGPLWLGVSVDGEAEMPRTELQASPFSIRARDADAADAVAPGAAVTSLNGLTDDVTINAGANVTITPSGNSLTIDATGGGGADADWVINGSDMHSGVSGNVGIGTSSPSARLHVNTATNVPADIKLKSGSSWDLLLTQSPNSLFTITNGNGNQVAFTSGGDLGIGTATPSARLHVATPVNTPADIKLRSGGSYDLLLEQSPNSLFTITNGGGNQLAFTSGGDFGIGTSAPSARLQVNTPVDTPADIKLKSGGSWDALLEQSPQSTFSIQNGGQKRVYIPSNGNVGIGEANPTAKLHVAGTARVTVLQIDGGADLAEPFSVQEEADVRPGMVLAIDPARAGHLRIARQAYDRRVAGIVSGANGVSAGITLRHEGTAADGSVPLALTGRAYCLADASYGPIEAGDLLTTSPTPGHAMKVGDFDRARGAILGKAMTSLASGRGHVLVLVGLQ